MTTDVCRKCQHSKENHIDERGPCMEDYDCLCGKYSKGEKT